MIDNEIENLDKLIKDYEQKIDHLKAELVLKRIERIVAKQRIEIGRQSFVNVFTTHDS